MIPYKEKPDGVFFQIKVLPRSSRCEVAGVHGDALKIKITAPPLEGKANDEVVRFLSKHLGVKVAQVSIVNGEHSRIKTIAVTGMTGRQFLDSLDCGDQ
jgi:uncharacterized protein